MSLCVRAPTFQPFFWNPLHPPYTIQHPYSLLTIIHNTSHTLFLKNHCDRTYLSSRFYLHHWVGISFSKNNTTVFNHPNQSTWVMFHIFLDQLYVPRSVISPTHTHSYSYLYNDEIMVFNTFLDLYVLTTSKSHLLSLPEISLLYLLIFILQTLNDDTRVFVSVLETNCF